MLSAMVTMMLYLLSAQGKNGVRIRDTIFVRTMAKEMSQEDQEFLAQTEEELKDRYTEKDEEFMKVFNLEPSVPPIVENWYPPSNRRNNFRGSIYHQGNNRDQSHYGRKRGYDDNRGRGYDDNRGRGYDDNRGRGYDDNRGRGYDDNRGRGYDDNRGRGYDDNRDTGHSSYNEKGQRYN